MNEKKISPSAASVHLALAVIEAASRGGLRAAYEDAGMVAAASCTIQLALEDKSWTGATPDCPPFGCEALLRKVEETKK